MISIMATLTHVFVFLVSAAVIWFFAGLLVETIGRVAKRFGKTGFSVAFFVLGFLTSISETSVAVNSWLADVPQVSAGNLIGASFVILLFILPFLAVAGGKIDLRHTLSSRNLAFVFLVIILPLLLIIDGSATVRDGILILLIYLVLVWLVARQHNSIKEIEEIPSSLLERRKATVIDGVKILLGGVGIFAAGYFLVEQAVYFSVLLGVPSSLIGLLLLSIGTNVPELVVATRSVLKRRVDIAFGDYLGSAAANSTIFALLVILSGGFSLEVSEFWTTALIMFAGLVCFYFFARSNREVSRKEGWILLSFYALFVVVQVLNILRLGAD